MKRSESPIDCAYLERDRGPSLRQGAGEAVWMLNPWSAAAASRFDRFVKDLPGYLLNAPPALSFLLCVIGYDCVLNEPDLIALSQAISNTPSFDPGVRITWTSDREGFRHTESRCLSVRTRLAGRRLANDIDWAASAAELERLLQDTNAAVNDIRDVFFSSFGASVRIERVRPRRGHPLGYLVVTGSQISAGKCAPSAAVRTHEFHGLLFSLSVFHAFRRGV